MRIVNSPRLNLSAATAPSRGLAKTIQRPVCVPYTLVVFLMAAASSCSWWLPVCGRVAADVACVMPCIVHVHATQGINNSASSEAAAAISGTLRVRRCAYNDDPQWRRYFSGVAQPREFCRYEENKRACCASAAAVSCRKHSTAKWGIRCRNTLCLAETQARSGTVQ